MYKWGNNEHNDCFFIKDSDNRVPKGDLLVIFMNVLEVVYPKIQIQSDQP